MARFVGSVLFVCKSRNSSLEAPTCAGPVFATLLLLLPPHPQAECGHGYKVGGAGEQLPAGKYGGATIYPQNMAMVSSLGQRVSWEQRAVKGCCSRCWPQPGGHQLNRTGQSGQRAAATLRSSLDGGCFCSTVCMPTCRALNPDSQPAHMCRVRRLMTRS